jgi:hypothetical protein
VQAATNEDLQDDGKEHAWTEQRGRTTAKLARRLLLALLAATSGVSDAAGAVVPYDGVGGSAADHDEGSGMMGWIVAIILRLVLLWRLLAERFEVRANATTRNMMVQGPVTYKVSFSLDGENRSRFHPCRSETLERGRRRAELPVGQCVKLLF